MPNLKWSQISHLQLGKIAEYYAQAEFLSYGFEIYDTVVDDRGIDFVARKDNALLEIQVKAVRNYNYTFISGTKMPNLSSDRLICYMNFIDGKIPDIYIFPDNLWEKPNGIFVHRVYEKNFEYGINISKKNETLIDGYKATNLLK